MKPAASPLSQLRGPPITSGRLVVGAATIAPVGSNVSSFSTSADLSTRSRQRPRYVPLESQRCQNCTVCWNSSWPSFSDAGHSASLSRSSSLTVNTCDLPSSSSNSATTLPSPSCRNVSPQQTCSQCFAERNVAPLPCSATSCGSRP